MIFFHILLKITKINLKCLDNCNYYQTLYHFQTYHKLFPYNFDMQMAKCILLFLFFLNIEEFKILYIPAYNVIICKCKHSELIKLIIYVIIIL